MKGKILSINLEALSLSREYLCLYQNVHITKCTRVCPPWFLSIFSLQEHTLSLLLSHIPLSHPQTLLVYIFQITLLSFNAAEFSAIKCWVSFGHLHPWESIRWTRRKWSEEPKIHLQKQKKL